MSFNHIGKQGSISQSSDQFYKELQRLEREMLRRFNEAGPVQTSAPATVVEVPQPSEPPTVIENHHYYEAGLSDAEAAAIRAAKATADLAQRAVSHVRETADEAHRLVKTLEGDYQFVAAQLADASAALEAHKRSASAALRRANISTALAAAALIVAAISWFT